MYFQINDHFLSFAPDLLRLFLHWIFFNLFLILTTAKGDEVTSWIGINFYLNAARPKKGSGTSACYHHLGDASTKWLPTVIKLWGEHREILRLHMCLRAGMCSLWKMGYLIVAINMC